MRGRGTNVIKIISLTLGLYVGVLLFAKIACELSYDTDYADADRLCIIMAKHSGNMLQNNTYSSSIQGPVPKAILEAFPNEVEYASICKYSYYPYYKGEERYVYGTIFADTLFFQTTGIKVLQGNVMELANPDVIFISDEFARKAFGDETPVGKTIMLNKKLEVSIKGVFKTMPENNSIRPDVVISFENIFKEMDIYFGWDGGSSYCGYARLAPGADIAKVNARMDAVISQYVEFDPEKNGHGTQYELWKLKDMHIKNPELRTKLTIMAVLGIALLLCAALNYVLIAISSLTLRAKGVGVHKCSGATDTNVFFMFIWETLIIVGVSLALVGLLIFISKDLIVDLLGTSLHVLFAWKTLWVPLLIVLFLSIISGVYPGRMFAKIPVSQIFKHYTEGKQGWKRPLLLVQFAGVSFIFGLLCVVMLQYHRIIHFDVGYKPEGLATAWHTLDNTDIGKSTIMHFPMVEAVAFSEGDIAYGLSGDYVSDANDKVLFSTRYNECDETYVPLLGIQIKEGKNIDGPNQVLVNEEYVRLMRWTDSPIGKRPQAESAPDDVIVGVMKDFVNSSLYAQKQPVLFRSSRENQECMSVRLKAPYRENLNALNIAVKEAFPADDIQFNYVPDRLEMQYQSARRFRDMVLLAFVAILLIALIGLLGYISNEVQRRSKEIAIRKVNGAEAYDILYLLSKEVSWLAFPSVAIGVYGAYLAGKEWLTQFARAPMDLKAPLFILIAIAVLIIIFSTVIIKSWRIANDDPVNSIKSE